MTTLIFKKVANNLLYISRKTGFTYNEINIIVYFFFIPFSWLVLLDILFQFYYFKISFLIFIVGFISGCRNFRTYSDWLFNKSVSFLKYFNKFGFNYVKASVWICVSIPIIIYAFLLFLILQ